MYAAANIASSVSSASSGALFYNTTMVPVVKSVKPKVAPDSNLAQRTFEMPPPCFDTYPPSLGQPTASAVPMAGDQGLNHRLELQVESGYPSLSTLSSVSDAFKAQKYPNASVVTDRLQCLEQTSGQPGLPTNFGCPAPLITKNIALGTHVLGIMMPHPKINQLEGLFAFHWQTQSPIVIVATPQYQINNSQLGLSAYFQKKEVYGTCAAVCQAKIGPSLFFNEKSFIDRYDVMLINSAQPSGLITKALQVIHVQVGKKLSVLALERLAALIISAMPNRYVSLPITIYESFSPSQVLILLGLLESKKESILNHYTDKEHHSSMQYQIQKIASMNTAELKDNISAYHKNFM